MAKKVLVIHRNPDFIESLRKKLPQEGYDVLWAFDSKGGMLKARGEPPDIILIDIMLESSGCIEFMENARKDKTLKDIPIIVTGNNKVLLEALDEKGLHDYLVEPFGLMDLLDKIKSHIGIAKGEKILVIDDEDDVRRVIEYRLKAHKFSVTTAVNGKDGLEKMAKEKPDLVILDFLMPVMDGFAFLRELRKNPDYNYIPVLMLTARGATKESFESFGASDFMPKPFDDMELLQKVEFLLKKKAIALCHDSRVVHVFREVFETRQYNLVIVNTEEELLQKLAQVKYKMVIAYILSVKSKPADFVRAVHSSKNKATPLVVYSNRYVPGTEKDNMVVLREIEAQWLDAKVDDFFDLRVAENDFAYLAVRYMELNK